ncbi:MAG: tetratricopeptide repeat protein [Pseudomonadota bacterium]
MISPPTESNAQSEAPGIDAYLQGLDDLNQARWDDAIQSFNRALQDQAENPDYLLARGVASTFARRLRDAEHDFERANRLRPNHKPTKLWWATAVAMQGRFAEDGVIYPPVTHDQYETTIRTMSKEFGDYYFRQSLGDDDAVAVAKPRYDAAIRSFPKLAKMFVERTRSEGGQQLDGLTAALRQRGIERYNTGKCDQAIEDLHNAYNANQADAEALYYLAGCKLQLGSPEGARHDYTEVLLAEPDHGYALLGRALALAELGDEPATQRDLAAAKSLLSTLDPAYEKQIENALSGRQDPASPIHGFDQLAALPLALSAGVAWDSFLQSAQDLVKSTQVGRLRADEAYQVELNRLGQAAQADGAGADEFAALGQFLYEQALIVVGEAVEPRAPNRSYRPQNAARQDSELAFAERAVDRALQLDPNHPRALAFKGASRFKRDNDWVSAEKYLSRAIDLDHQDPVILDLFAIVLDYIAFVQASAAAELRSVDSWEDTHYIYYRYPSEAELRRANELDALARRLWDKARRALNAAIASAPDSAQASYYQSILAERDGDLAAAEAHLKQALAHQSDYFEAAQRLSTIAHKLGHTTLAYDAQSIATNLVQTSAAPMLKLAWIEFNRTAYEKATRALSKAAELDPADPRVAAFFGAIAEATGDNRAAMEWFLTAAALEEVRLANLGRDVRGKAYTGFEADHLARLFALYNRAADILNKLGHSELAAQLLNTNFALYQQLGEETKFSRSSSGILPEPRLDPGKIPEAPTIEGLIVWSAIHAGRANTDLGQYDTASQFYDWAAAFESRKPPSVDQGMAVRLPGTWGRLGLADVALQRGNLQQASDHMQDFGYPSVATPAMDAEAARLRNAIEAAGYRATGQTLHDLRDQQKRNKAQELQNQETW